MKVLFWNLFFCVFFGGIAFGGLEVFLRYEKNFHQDTVSAVGIPIYQPDALNTYAHKPGAFAENGYGVPTPEIHINNIGFRDENFEANNWDKNILMLGDSFTFGTGVDQEDTFSEILESQLGERWKVWNAGHIGYSIDNYYLLMQKYAELMKPDLVIMNIFVANDITELRRKHWIMGGEEILAVKDQKVFANTEGKLESKETQIPQSYAWHWLNERFEILMYKNGWKRIESEPPTLTWPVFLSRDHPAQDPELQDYWNRFTDVMKSIKYFSEISDIPVLISLIPMDVQVDKGYEKKYAVMHFDQEAKEADRPQKHILHWCKKLDLTCANPLSEFRNHPQRHKLYFLHNADPHFDTLGHVFYADFLLKELRSLGL